MFENLSLHGICQFMGELLFPGRCLLCKTYIPASKNPNNQNIKNWVCASCLDEHGLFPFEEPYCILCGHEFARGESHVCEECLRHPPPTQKVRSAFWYQGVVTQLIPLYKYRYKLCLTKIFQQALFEAYYRHFTSPEPDIIIPIPLHGARLFSRKFNQAYLMVKRVPEQYKERFQKETKMRIDVKSLIRVRATNYQTGFDKKMRRKNMKNAFSLTPGAGEKIQGKYILLVDDVYTSGATCREAARVLLKNGGARRVDVLTLARA